MIKKYCVPVALDANVLNRDKESDEGKFYRAHFAGAENMTFLATAGGRRLEKGWEDWYRLPAAERRPGGVKVPDLSRGKTADPAPPPGGLIANVYLRSFQRSAARGLEYEKTLEAGEGRYESEPGRDHLWLTRGEWRSLVPRDPRPGNSFPLPAPVRDRIVRYHLLLSPDRVVGVGWGAEHVRKAALKLTVERVLPDRVELRLDGPVLVCHPPEARVAKSGCGYDARLYGRLTFDRKAGAFTRFDVLAFGRFWDCGDDWRKGRSPVGWLGVAFELVTPGKVEGKGWRAPPYLLMREENDYFGKGR